MDRPQTTQTSASAATRRNGHKEEVSKKTFNQNIVAARMRIISPIVAAGGGGDKPKLGGALVGGHLDTARSRSADFQPAVSQVCDLPGREILRRAELRCYFSQGARPAGMPAIQQAGEPNDTRI
jgi:hypothetical protein